MLINFSLEGGTIKLIKENDQLGKFGFTIDDFKEKLVLLRALFKCLFSHVLGCSSQFNLNSDIYFLYD